MSLNQKVSASPISSHPPGKVRGLPIFLNPDGTITRLGPFPQIPATPDPSSNSLVLTKDIPLNPQYNTFVRVFLPVPAVLDHRSSSHNMNKLPLIVYFHGGAFLFYSAASPIFHKFCSQMAIEVGAVVVSVNYRLSPEHRLPAAYDDGMEALHTIAKKKDEWLCKFADFSSCFLMGSSVGGNIVYNIGRRLAAMQEFDNDLRELKFRGLVMLHSTFGGEERTGSEVRFANDQMVPLLACDLSWELSLPRGSDRNHEYSNPFANGSAKKWGKVISKLGWRLLIIGCDTDPLSERQKELTKVLRAEGVPVVANFWETGYHIIELYDKKKAEHVFENLKNLICSPSSML